MDDNILSQLPPGIIAYAVMIPVLIIGLLAYAALIRPALKNRKKRKDEDVSLTMPSPSPSVKRSPQTMPAPSLGEDMPELDLFLPHELAARPVGPRQLGEADVTLVTGETVHAREELVLLRDPADGRLIVQMVGVTYKSFTSAPGAKERFSRLMNELAKSLAQSDGATLAPADVAPAPVDDVPMPNAPAPVPTPLPPIPPLVTPLPSGDNDEPLPGDLPRYNNMRGAQLKGRGFLGRPKFEFEDVPDLNLAKSIEAYLQHRLAQTPGYVRRAWHVHPALDGGVRIEIDGQFFDSVSEISDPAARAFIQTTIQEWQDRQ